MKVDALREQALGMPSFQAFIFMKAKFSYFLSIRHSMESIYDITRMVVDVRNKVVMFVGDWMAQHEPTLVMFPTKKHGSGFQMEMQ